MSANSTYWAGHYNTAAGPAKVDAREALYFCLEKGEEPIDFNQLAADTISGLGILATERIVDVGCGGRLKFLDELERRGYRDLYGVEPNTEQFGWQPHWEPLAPDPVLEALKQRGNPEQLKAFYERLHDLGRFTRRGQSIKLLEADANFIALETGSAAAVTWLFSGQHIDEDKQVAAVEETRRLLDPGGVMGLGLSYADNKSGMRMQEDGIKTYLSDMLGLEVTPPKPTNACMTMERGLELMLAAFSHVWVHEHETTIVIDTPGRVQKLYVAHTTTKDSYTVHDGESTRQLTNDEYNSGLLAVVGVQVVDAKIRATGKQRGRIEDKLHRGLAIASDRYIKEVPPGYKYVKAA